MCLSASLKLLKSRKLFSYNGKLNTHLIQRQHAYQVGQHDPAEAFQSSGTTSRTPVNIQA